MNIRYLQELEREVSEEIQCVPCPTCRRLCPINMTFLVDDGRLVDLSICDNCADHRTIRAFRIITPGEWTKMADAGVPIVAVDQGKS